MPFSTAVRTTRYSTAVAANGVNPGIELFGVEPEAGNDFQRSLAAGERVHIEVPGTIADGLQTQSPGELTFPIVRALTRGIVTVNDDDLRAAMRFAFERLKIVIEPSGAAGLAALLAKKLDVRNRPVAVVISGGNVDLSRFSSLLTGYDQ